MQFRDNDVDITGQDAVSSVLLPDDETFWIFGDTIEGPFDSIRGFELTEVLSNTGAIVPLQDISRGVSRFRYLTEPSGARARQLIGFVAPEHKSTQRLWAIHGVHTGGSLYLYYHRITMDPTLDVFETFTLDGMGIARAGRRPRVRAAARSGWHLRVVEGRRAGLRGLGAAARPAPLPVGIDPAGVEVRR